MPKTLIFYTVYILKLLWIVGAIFCFLPPLNHLYAYHPEHFEDLRSQVASKKNVNCVGYHLENADLSDLNLKRANFSRSYLSGVNFTNSNLSKANFQFCDMTNAQLTKAVVNGAQFHGARLGGINYDQISGKGTFFSDKTSLFEKISYENTLQKITEKFLEGAESSINMGGISEIKAAYDFFHTSLINHSSKRVDYLIFDFRPVMLEGEELRIFFQECLYFLKAPFFKHYVPNVQSIDDSRGILCFMSERIPCLQIMQNDESLFLPTRHEKVRDSVLSKFLSIETLDLHGKFPVSLKFNWVSKFIKESCRKNRPYVHVITGRGLHNPEGKVGVFWKLCRNYLKQEKFQDYVKKINPISKNGGWKVILKKHSKALKKISYCDLSRQKKSRKSLSVNKRVLPLNNDYRTIVLGKKTEKSKGARLKKMRKKQNVITKRSKIKP